MNDSTAIPRPLPFRTPLQVVMNDLVATVPHPYTGQTQTHAWGGCIGADEAEVCGDMYWHAEAFRSTPDSDPERVQTAFRLAYCLASNAPVWLGGFTPVDPCDFSELVALAELASSLLPSPVSDSDEMLIASLLSYAFEC